MAASLALPRRSGRDPLATTAAWALSGLALELAIAFLLVHSLKAAGAVLAVALMALVTGLIVKYPQAALTVLAATWGVFHSVLGDLNLVSFGSIDLTLARMLGVLFTVSMSIVLLTGSRARAAHPKFPLPIKALLVVTAMYLLLDVPLAASKSTAISDLLRIASGVLIGAVAFREYDSAPKFLRLARVVTVVGVAVAVITVMQFLLLQVAPGVASAIFGSSFFQTSEDISSASSAAVRVAGPLGGPQETAGLLLVAMGFVLVRINLLPARVSARRLGWAATIISLGILITLTRAAIGGLLALLLIWIVQRQSNRFSAASLRLRLFGLMALAIVALVATVGAQQLGARLSDINPSSSGASFAQGRGGIWQEDFAQLSASNPIELIVGHGGHSSYVPVLTPLGTTILSPHNIFIWSLVETGVAGLMVYLVFLFSSLRAYFTVSRTHRFRFRGQVAAVGFGLSVAYLLQDQFTLSVSSPGHRWYFMLFLGATLRLCVGSGVPADPRLPDVVPPAPAPRAVAQARA